MSLSYFANLLSSPLVHVPVLMLILWGLRKGQIFPKVCKYLYAVPIFWLYLCSLVYPSVLLIKPLEDKYPTISLESDTWKSTDAIVVLACYHFDDEALPYVSRWPNCSLQRNLHAALMYQIKPIPIFLAAQSIGDNNPKSLAEYNKQFFMKFNVPEADIVITPEGFNTQTEAKALAKLLKGKRISLVTSASHMPRAVKYFEQYDLSVLPIPVEHLSRKDIKPMLGRPNANSLYRSERAIHEYLGLINQYFTQ